MSEGDSLTFRVVGTPAPQGSKKHVGGGRMIESSKAVGPWRDVVTYTVRRDMMRRRQPMITNPVKVTMIFLVRRPPSIAKRIIHPSKRPDLDKLIRATCDALTDAGLIRDDAQICNFGDTRKEYAKPGVAPGVWIRLEILENDARRREAA